MSNKRYYPYFIKDNDGQLIPKRDCELLELHKKKVLKADSLIYSCEFNQWLKLKELSVFINKQQITPLESEDLLEYDEDNLRQVKEEITAQEKLHDAKAIISKLELNHTKVTRELKIENTNLKNKVDFLQTAHSSKTTEIKDIKAHYDLLYKEFNELSKEFKFQRPDNEFVKLKAEIKKLNTHLKLTETNYQHIEKTNQDLIQHTEQIQNELSSLQLSNQKLQHKNEHLLSKQDIYHEKLKYYKEEILRLNHELDKKKSIYRQLSDKFLNAKNDSSELYLENGLLKQNISLTKSEKEKTHNEYIKLVDKYRLKFDEALELKDTSIHLQDANQELSHQLKNLEEQNDSLKKKNKSLTKEIQELKELPPVPKNHISLVQHNDEILKLETSLEDIQSNILSKSDEIEVLNEKLKLKEEEIIALKKKLHKFSNDTIGLTTTISKQEKQIKSYEQMKEVFKKRYGDKVVFFNHRLKSYKDELISEKKKNEEILKNLKNVEHDSIHIDQLLDQQKEISQGEIIEDNNSIGALFEVENDKIWSIKLEGKIQGPYSFLEIKELMSKEIIQPESLIKKQGRAWCKLSENFELNTTILTKTVNNEVKVYIERNKLRVPVFEDVILEINDKKIIAKCTNLSTGGCYIESTGLTMLNGYKDISELNCSITFTGKGKHNGVFLKGKLRSYSKSSIPGIGVEFINVNENILNSFSDIFNRFTRSFGKKAA